MAGSPDALAPRFMFYCHDSIGLGHVRRARVLGGALQARWPAMAQLVVTGLNESPQFAWPVGTDYVKLPSILYLGRGRGPEPWRAYLPMLSLEEVRAMRSDILLTVARNFRPDVLVADHLPAGQGGELLPVLRYLKESRPKTRRVLGLRDISDEPQRLRQAWSNDGSYDALDQLYDLILVYGQREIFDVAAQAALPARTAAKLRYVGYLRRQAGPTSPAQLRGELDVREGRFVLVAVGGGADGYDVLRIALEASCLSAEARALDWVLVGGPLMPAVDRERLTRAMDRHARVRILDAVADLAGYIAAADVVVSRGGYNTVCEILSFDRPAVLVPRVTFGVEENLEQLIRAEALTRRGLVQMIHPAGMTPARLLTAVMELLQQPRPPGRALDMGGLPATVAAIEEVMESAPR